MNNQLLLKSKDVVVKRAIVRSSAGIELRKPCPQELPLHTPPACTRHGNLVSQSSSSRLSYFNQQANNFNQSNLRKEVECLLFSDKESKRNKKNKALALSIMYANIRREMPLLLEVHDYKIYSDDLEFISTFPIIPSLQGRSSYQITLKTWFTSLTLLYSGLYIDILNLTKDTENNSVEMRWAISGQYRINQLNVRVFEGVSTFTPNDTGLITRHMLDKVNIDKIHGIFNKASPV